VALDQMQSDAFYADRCGWVKTATMEVCLRPTDRDMFVWCKKHNRQLVRESERRRREKERPSTSFPAPIERKE
jgi:hypothetical protein